MNKKTFVVLFSCVALIVVGLLWWYLRGASVVLITSDDGNVTLSVPKNALPEGVRAEDISIKSLSYDAIKEKPPVEDFYAAYEFQPDGLLFATPVEISFALKDFAETSVPAVTMVGDKGSEPLANQKVNIDAALKTASITGVISHFSYSIIERGFFAVKITDPENHLVGETFAVEGIQAVARKSYIFSSDVSQITRHTLTDNPEVTGYVSVRLPHYAGDTSAVTPRNLDDFPRRVTKIPESGELKSVGNLTCAEPGEAILGYVIRIENGTYESRQRGYPNGVRAANDDLTTPEDPSYPDRVRQNKYSIDITYSSDSFECVAAATPPPPALRTGEPVQEMIQVISYGGKQLPVAQLQIENETGCGERHYHAANGSVTTTDGTKLRDPGPPCGYGKVSQRPTVSIAATASEATAVSPQAPTVSKPSGGTVVVCGLPGGPSCPKR